MAEEELMDMLCASACVLAAAVSETFSTRTTSFHLAPVDPCVREKSGKQYQGNLARAVGTGGRCKSKSSFPQIEVVDFSSSSFSLHCA